MSKHSISKDKRHQVTVTTVPLPPGEEYLIECSCSWSRRVSYAKGIQRKIRSHKLELALEALGITFDTQYRKEGKK